MLYLAYGSNLNVQAMLQRCPKARKIGAFELTNARLVFRGVADVEYAEDEICPAGLWEITRECEEKLDLYEGVSSNLYRKVYLKLKYVDSGRIRKCLVYQMNHAGISPPDQHYLNVIAKGYEDFGLDLDYLDRALQHSWDEKRKTPFLKRRQIRRGNKPLAIAIGDQA